MSRNPLLIRACAVAAVGILAAFAEARGVPLPPLVRDNLTEAAIAAAPFVLAFWGRRKVTPVSDPRSADGTPLVPAPTPSDLGGIVPDGSEAAQPRA
ncbi:hypothetical protein ACPXB5_11350 [Micromonospora arida]|uniref:hypothetical protein n=1 Tax=Micromonospora arida TaxID=2203715 RepID=UPI003CF1B9A7